MMPARYSGNRCAPIAASRTSTRKSNVETYVALKVGIDNWRWAGVPFYIRTGKSMTRRTTEIAIRFKPAPLALFEERRLQQDVGQLAGHPGAAGGGHLASIRSEAPGPDRRAAVGQDEFRLQGLVSASAERRLRDAALRRHDRRPDAVPACRPGRAGWRVVQPVLEAWAKAIPDDFPNYIAGTAGPAAADALLAQDGGRSWRPVAVNSGPKGVESKV